MSARRDATSSAEYRRQQERYFGLVSAGMSRDEAREHMGISRDKDRLFWRYYREMTGHPTDPEGEVSLSEQMDRDHVSAVLAIGGYCRAVLRGNRRLLLNINDRPWRPGKPVRPIQRRGAQR